MKVTFNCLVAVEGTTVPEVITELRQRLKIVDIDLYEPMTVNNGLTMLIVNPKEVKNVGIAN